MQVNRKADPESGNPYHIRQNKNVFIYMWMLAFNSLINRLQLFITTKAKYRTSSWGVREDSITLGR